MDSVPNNAESSTDNRSSRSFLPVDRREYLTYTGVLTGGSLLAQGSAAAEDTGDDAATSDVDRLTPVDLQVESATDPLGVDDERPELSWRSVSTDRSASQSAYHVLVASSPEKLSNDTGDMWDSGKVSSSEPRATYDGESLESTERYYWKVRVWEEDEASEWSEPAWWEMGLLDDDDWTAEWIRAPSHEAREFYFVRDEFDLDSSDIVKARAYASAGHQYELHINGTPVDRGPAYNYPDDQYYKTIDVTEALRAGERNAIGALYNWNGPGQYRPANEPGFIVQLHVEYDDGSTTVVTTDDSWRVRQAPWEDTAFRNGDLRDPIEVIDGRGFPEGWTEPGFDDGDWEAPEVVGTHPTAPWEELISQLTEIERHTVEPASLTTVESGNLAIVDDHLQVAGGGVSLSEAGADWEDYTFELDVRRPEDTDRRPAAGFVFRAPDEENGYMWQLGGEGGSSELRVHVLEDGDYELLESVPFEAELGVWYHVRIELDGPQISTYIDGELIDERSDETFTGGRVGFREAGGEVGEFDNITVTSEDEVLFEDDFSGNLDAWEDGGTVYVADFGRVIAGVPRVRFENGESGRRIDMRAGYLLTDDGRVSAERGTQSTDMSYGYVQRDGAQTFEPFYYLGFRYFQVESPGESLDADQVTAIARHHDVPDEHAATFSSSNDTLDDVWELARHSALYGSQEQFVDTPTREKAQFLGDAFNISSTTMRAFGERKLTQKAFREFFRSQERFWSEEGRLNAVYPNGDGKRDIPDYTEKFPEWVWQYYLLTGDRELLAEAYPVVRNVAEYVARYVDADTGLVRNLAGGGGPYEFGIVDWPDEMRYGYDRDPQAMTTINVLGWNVFRRTAQIADVLGESNSAGWNDSAESLREAINEHLLGDDGVYVDGLFDDGSRSSHASQHANAFPLSFGIVPDDVVDSVVDHIIDQGVAMGPQTIHRLLFALDAVDEDEALLDVITNPEHDGWANILANGGTFTWESWHSLELAGEFGDNRSLSHPWGATVLIAIQRSFLGVQVTEPGASHVEITPPSEALAMASGRVPTERGDVHVDWNRTQTTQGARTRGEYELDVTIPANVGATVRIPTLGGERVRVRESGKTIWNNGNRTRPEHPGIENVSREGDQIVVEISSGDYAFELASLGSPDEATYYQVDFIAGEPIEELTADESGDYSLQNREIRFLHGSSEEPVTRTGAPTHTLDDSISACLADDLEHIWVEDGQAMVEFTVHEGCELTLSLVSYEKTGPGWSRQRQPTQEFIDAETDTFGPGTHTLTVDLPNADGEESDDQ